MKAFSKNYGTMAIKAGNKYQEKLTCKSAHSCTTQLPGGKFKSGLDRQSMFICSNKHRTIQKAIQEMKTQWNKGQLKGSNATYEGKNPKNNENKTKSKQNWEKTIWKLHGNNKELSIFDIYRN